MAEIRLLANTKTPSKNKNPNRSIRNQFFRQLEGSNPPKTLYPSNGGIGKRLKIPRRKFTITPYRKSCCIGNHIIFCNGNRILNRNKNPKRIPKKIFTNGPPKATFIIALSLWVKFRGLIGTGLAPPNITGLPNSIRDNGRRIVNNISI